MTDNPVTGHCDTAFAGVRDAFAQGFAEGEEIGAAVAVYSGDRLVVDLWGGLADHRAGRPWLRDTPCPTFSCTKAVTATAALMLAERGAYDLEGPVTAWWPEFGVRGKDAVTAEHLLSHQAGLPALDRPVRPDEAHDPAAMAAMLAAQAPEWKPGSAHGYHALTFGWLAGEIVRRHSGRTVGEFVRTELSPDLHLGASDAVIKAAARLSGRRPNDGGPGSGLPGGRFGEVLAAVRDPQSLLNRTFENPKITDLPGGNNNPAMLRAGWPAVGLVTTARSLAGLYRDLMAGRHVDRPTLVDAIVRRVSGPDRVMVIDSSFGLGFMRPSPAFPTPPKGRDSAFGHTGLGGSIGLADIEHGLALAYTPNAIGDPVSGGLRAYRLVEAMYATL